jgi:hypothetical protein
MKHIASLSALYTRLAVLGLCFLFALTIHAEPLPSAPVPTHTSDNTMTVVDWSLAGGVLAGRALDWASTRQMLRNGYHEEILPSGLAHSKVGLGVFEMAAAGASVLMQRYETRHGHRRIARTVAMFNTSVSLGVDAHNFSLTRPR